MFRNPLYGFARVTSVRYTPSLMITCRGNQDISDKYAVPGWYLATARESGRLKAFEFYCVLPWAFGKCLRARLGWKIMTDKFQRNGFAPLVNTCNPFKGYGESINN